MAEGDLVEFVLAGLWAALLLVVPLLVVGAATGASVGALAGRLGIQDSSLARAARVLAVVGALVFTLGLLGDRMGEIAAQSWARMGDVDGPVGAAGTGSTP